MRFLLAVAVLGLLPAAAFSQPDWERVRQLRPNQPVKVRLRSGDVLKGKVESAGEEGLRLVGKGGQMLEASKADILRVTRKSRIKGLFWGGVIGFGIAAPIGAYAGPYIADWGDPPTGIRLRHAAGFGLFFGGVGAGLGALGGMETTIYRAPGLGK